MPIDSFTVLLFGLFLKLVLGGLFVVFWLNDRRALWYAWWSGTFFLACVAAGLFLVRGVTADLLSIGIGNVALMAAFATSWQAARVFDGRKVLWWATLLAPAIWFAACLIPAFLTSVPHRVVLSSVLAATLLGATALEFWRGRHEALPSRWAVIALFASFALFFAIRIPLVGSLPFPFGALPAQPGWLGAFNLILFFHTVLLTVLLVSMTKERLELEQRIKAQTDPLTGALNRRAFVARGGRLLHRHQHDGDSLCLLFLDIDHFKSLNDRFGHSGGDDVLMTFVAVVQDNIRPTDFLFRIGGEEFCCVLPRTTAEHALVVAERIRHRFEMRGIDVAGVPVRATVSVGIASTEAFGYDLDTLTRRADMAVYAAKRQGRNRVVVASDEIAVGEPALAAMGQDAIAQPQPSASPQPSGGGASVTASA
jgi:diguanylate cyclase (GGDEF)-like protein